MSAPVETNPLPDRHFGLSRNSAGLIAFAGILLLVGVRGASEISMMIAHGSDAQMAIWELLLLLKLALWLLAGGLFWTLLIVFWHKRWGLRVSFLLLAIWSVAICSASWEYGAGRRTLVDASDPSTSPERLSELVDFGGIQAGYELDNRIASHPNTAPEDLRKLYQRGNLGTLMCLARNPNTPEDILEKLAEHEDFEVLRSLTRNPNLPESVLQKLRDHPIPSVKSVMEGRDVKN